MRRLFDLLFATAGLALTLPVVIPALILIWAQDFHSPFYVSERVGKDGRSFGMIKLRSMRIDSDQSGVDSTKTDDPRITRIGKFLRRFKLDEIGQLVNVLMGQMTFVGPRPQVWRDVELYTDEEMRLLSVNPGITDISSIVFSDEGEILQGSVDPDTLYRQIIRPWKSRLGLLYIDNRTIWLDIRLMYHTAQALFSRQAALRGINRILRSFNASETLITVAERKAPLFP